MISNQNDPDKKQKPETTTNSFGYDKDSNFGESFNSKSTKLSHVGQTNYPFVFSKIKTVCPCGEHISFNALTSHTSGGKCWSCDKFFKPNSNAVSPYFIQPVQTINNTSKGTLNRFEREHIYWTNNHNNFLTKVVVWKDENNKKYCPQYRWDGELIWQNDGTRKPEGIWIKGIKGITTTLYNAFDLTALQRSPLKDSTYIYIVEGEKDVDTLKEHGKIATCNPMGAGNWKDYYSQLLKDLTCIIIPDNDEAGRKHAALVYKSLVGIAKCVGIVNLLDSMPGLRYKGDVTDFYNMGGKL